ncbi:MAG TPA: PfkB family carbohydrate kinase [Gaiellaceae bacterium]|nr:PfkB family carbohydrate kinase [Gaiellaceae bacterium]
MIALLGNLACDLFPDGVPRVGGGAYHGGRALRRLRVPARIVTRCARAQRDVLLPPLVRMGTPVRWMAGESTATFEFEFHGEERKMQAVELGDVWRPGDLSMLPSTRWVHIAPLFRGEFPTETLAALARRCRVSFDAQGLVRAPELGPLHLDANYDPEILRHLWVLKLADEEAEVVGDVTALGVKEMLVTHGSRGSTVYYGGVKEFVPARALDVNATGAGDAFATAYIVGRQAGLRPVGAARRATAVVASVLAG